MKTKAISSFFVLFALAAGMVTMTPAAFADHSEVTVEPAEGSGFTGCENTAEGCYIPSTATVDVGGKVIFSNTDSVAHTFTSGTAEGDDTGAVFDSGLAIAGSSYEWSPTETGEQPYFCIVHPWMAGMIIVQEVGAPHDDDGHGDVGTIMPPGDGMMPGDDMMMPGDDMMMPGDDMMMPGDDMMMPGDSMSISNEATATGMLSDGTMVSISTSEPTAGEMMEISIKFDGAEHVNHDIMVTQNGEEVLNDEGAHHHEGTGMHTTAPLSSSDPVDVTVTFQGYGVSDPKTGPIGEQVVFSNVVPEFGTIAMMILAVAIISIVAITAKSRVIPRF